MAANSKREKILANIAETVGAVDGIKTVKRIHPKMAEVKQWAATSLPFVGIVGGLPNPVDEALRSVTPAVIAFDSMLQADLLFVGIEKENPDTAISHWADELWKAIYADITRGGAATTTRILPDLDAGIDPPYVAFFMTVRTRYIHDNNGI